MTEFREALNKIDPDLLPYVFVLLGVIVLIAYIPFLFFCNSVAKGLKRVPAEKYVTHPIFAWLMLLPFVGVVFMWILMAFEIPNSFSRVVEGNDEALVKMKSVRGFGWAFVILVTASMIPYIPGIISIAMFVVWIIYWVKIVDFRKRYLE